MKGIADTGFIVAFARGNDQHHVWAVDIAKQITEPLLTCEADLAEAAFQLESRSYVLALLQDGAVRLGIYLCICHKESAGLGKRDHATQSENLHE